MNMKDYTNTSKKNIISALRDKGVDVNDDVEWYELDDKIEQITTGARHDWNENDPTKPGYIKNRPFYTGNPVETVLVEESTVSFVDSNQGLYIAEFQSNFVPTVGEVYKVSWDGTVYECTCVEFPEGTIIGNLSLAGEGSDTGEPFLINIINGEGMIIGTLDTSASHTFSISGFVPEVVKIDRKYLPTTVGFITYTSAGDDGIYSSDLTYNELYEILLAGGQVILSVPADKDYCYLIRWRKNDRSGRIDLVLGEETNGYRVSLFPDGTIVRTPVS